jgi:hypothetical protein
MLPEDASDDMTEEPLRMTAPKSKSKSFRMEVIDC